jgi:hypothetical protein
MAVRTWTAPLGVAIGAGVLAGAGQLGIGDGLGILRWNQRALGAAAWHTQLTWIAFVSASAVIVAALAGDWRASRLRQRPGLGQRIATVAAGAVGAAIVLPLTARPAGGIGLAEAGNPRLIVAITAAAGLLIGLIGAFAVLTFPAVRGNVISCTAWVWLASMVSAVWALGNGSTWASARLAQLPPGGVWTPAVLVGAPVLVALIVSAVARFGGGDPITISLSGGTGPLLIAGAYVVAGPDGQSSAYWSALIAVAAGLAISVPVAFVRRPTTASPGAPLAAPVPALVAGVDAGPPAVGTESGSGPADAGAPAGTPAGGSHTGGAQSDEAQAGGARAGEVQPGEARTGGARGGGAQAGETRTGQDRPGGGPDGAPAPAPGNRASLLKAARALGQGRAHGTHGTAGQPGSTGQPATPAPVPEASPAPDLWSTPDSDAAYLAATQQAAVYRQRFGGQPPIVTQYAPPAEQASRADGQGSPPAGAAAGGDATAGGAATDAAAGRRGGRFGWRIPRARKAPPAEASAPLQPPTAPGSAPHDSASHGTASRDTALRGTARGETTAPGVAASQTSRRPAGRMAAGPDPTNAGTTNPGTTNPGTTNPGTTNPGTTKAADTTTSGKDTGANATGTKATGGKATSEKDTGTNGADAAGGGARNADPTSAEATAGKPGKRRGKAAKFAPAAEPAPAAKSAPTAQSAPGAKSAPAGKSAPATEPGGRQTATGTAGGGQATPEPAGSGPTAGTEPVKQRRWASRRKADAPPPVIAPEDDEYVDWVKGLGAAEPTVRIGGNRAARHARDARESPDPSS